jgi:CBS domain-containing protein
MTFTLEELLPDDQQLTTVKLHDSVQHALGLMHQHGYDQLPVVDMDGKLSLGLVVTFDSILQAVRSFETMPEQLQIRDVARTAPTYAADVDLLATLDLIQRQNFALIVDDNNVLTGIITTADTAVFFREYAQYLMQIQGIELRMKEAIKALYAGDDAGLESAIAAVTDRAADIRKRIPAAIRGYLERVGLNTPVAGEAEGFTEAEKRLALPKPGKEFDLLSFDEFIGVLLGHPNAPKLTQSKDEGELRRLLQQVRDARNKVAHFRGELSAEERRTIQFASEWLERNLPVPNVEPPAPPVTIVVPPPGSPVPQEDEDESPKGSYALLAAHLKAQVADVTSLPLTFQEVERILGKELPRSAHEYRAWWANDPTKPQSAAWLEEGWRTTSLSMTERRLTFVRTSDREEAYIRFFAKLNARLEQETGFPLRNTSPQGQSWIVLASFQHDSKLINAAFTQRKELRIELYIDIWDKAGNKSLFAKLVGKKATFEAAFGEPLQWERLDNKRACRVAVYTKAQILTDADSPKLLDWAVKKAVALHRAFAPEFT